MTQTLPPKLRPPGNRSDDVLLGIGMMVASTFVFGIMNVLVKVSLEHYPVNQVMFFRNAVALIPVGVAVATQGGFGTLRTSRPFGHVWRAVIGQATMLLMFWSFALLPLADATALNFSAPLFLTALSIPLLGEKVGPYRWSALLVGFVGVLVMVRPGGEVLNLGALVALGGALANALAMITVRQLSRHESPNSIAFYFTLISALLTAASLPFSWVTPVSWSDLAMLLGCGLFGGAAQLFLTRAYSFAPAAAVAPFNYVAILWAVSFGWMLWGEVPDNQVMVGAAIVILSGLYIFYRETRLRRAVTRAVPTGEAD